MHEGRRLSWDDWYTQFNHTLYDHDMTDTDAEFRTFMYQMPLDFLASRDLDWRVNWYEVSPELRDRLERLNYYQSEGLPCTEVSVAQAWLVQYEHERSRLGLNTPPSSPRDSAWGNFESGWATTWDTPPASPEVRAAVAAAALIARDNQTAPQATSITEEEDWAHLPS